MTGIGVGIGVSVYKNPPQGILDQISGAVAAYSLRKLKSNAIKCIRIRRSSDNLETDISFAGNILDTNTLLSFVDSGSGYITKWYDQSGYNNDAVQSTATYQPVIVSSGIMQSINNKPSIVFNGSSQSLVVAHSPSLALTNTFTFDAWIKMNSWGSNNTGRIFDKTYATNYGWYPSGTNQTINTATDNEVYSSSTNALSNYTQPNHLLTSFDKNLTSNNIKLFINNTNVGSFSKTTAITTDSTSLRIGNNASLTRGFDGKIAELIIRNTDVATLAGIIYNNGKFYYGV